MTTIAWPERIRRAALALVVCLGVAGAPAAGAGACPPLPRGVEIALGAHAEARALLWRVTSPDGRASVVLGTMHAADPRVMQVAEAVWPTLAASRHYALEVVLDDAALAALNEAMFFADGRRLPELLGGELFRRAAGYLALHGIPAALAETLKPWAAFTLLSQPPAAGLPLDLALMREASARGMPVSGLETVAEQVAVFERMPPEQTLTLLREAVCHYDVMQADFARMVGLYGARDLAGLTRLSLKYVDGARLPLLEDLLWSRNRRMVERMQPLLAAGDSFIAIGALHLPGDRGVLRLLEQRGYAVEAIY